jgi:hypothetical protein
MRAEHLLSVVWVTLSGVAFAATPPVSAGTTSSPQPITNDSWRNHPSIVAIRALVEANEAAIKSGHWGRGEKRVCESEYRALWLERIVFRDETGRVRKYVSFAGTDDSGYTLEHQFDERGRLRFVYAKSAAVNHTVREDRIYFDEDGRRIWTNRHETGPGYAFTPEFPETYIVRDPEVTWSAKPKCD